MPSSFSSDNFSVSSLCKTLMILGLLLYLIYVSLSNQYPNCPASDFFSPIRKRALPTNESSMDSPTNISHLVFGLLGSVPSWPNRKPYIESWWRPNVTRGYVYLDKAPTDQDLLPWSKNSPPYKISENLTDFVQEIKGIYLMNKMVHGIKEVFREERENLRWIIMGDDDTIFFVDNIVDVLAKLDHNKYYFIGHQSEFIWSNFWYSFNQAFGGGGFILSYALAKALSKDMENCLRRHAHLNGGRNSADMTTMACIADLGVDLTPHQGMHQIDLRGDISGFLSSHPKSPILSFHHYDVLEPLFPSKDRYESARHLMKAANVDQSRLVQQTICHHRDKNWSFSISWGYSAHIYERIMPRSYLQNPIETFTTWTPSPHPPNYMFNTRMRSNDPCEAPHVFFFESIEKTSRNEVLTSYSRASPRGFPACASSGNHSADFISKIEVISPATKRIETDRCECCDIVRVDGMKAEIKFRECMVYEIIA
ncbi:Protein of unknown function (DUF604) [Abeliophyllum distichum]|uniref:Uncharacterized protein n=1 Tax=Abeliophyllum distichum TaxID=126358 RepID=A0ABD1TDR3_9LAMI